MLSVQEWLASVAPEMVLVEVRQGTAIDLVWDPVAKGKAVWAPLPFTGRSWGTERAKVGAVPCLLRFEATSCKFYFPLRSHFLSAHITQVRCQLSATGTFVPKLGFNPEVYPWIFFVFLHPPLGEDNLPFLPLQGASCSSGTAAHPLPVNVSLCFLSGKHWSHNWGKLLHNSGQQAFCFTLMVASDERECGCTAMDNKGLSPVHGPVSLPMDPLLITLLTPCMALEKVAL